MGVRCGVFQGGCDVCPSALVEVLRECGTRCTLQVPPAAYRWCSLRRDHTMKEDRLPGLSSRYGALTREAANGNSRLGALPRRAGSVGQQGACVAPGAAHSPASLQETREATSTVQESPSGRARPGRPCQEQRCDFRAWECVYPRTYCRERQRILPKIAIACTQTGARVPVCVYELTAAADHIAVCVAAF